MQLRKYTQPTPAEDRRVLSIQSHVASGYVGNRAATFPLQLLGWDVDVVNTVQFSNHAAYGRFGGSKVEAAQLESLFQGLRDNGLMRASRLLTGFIPGAQALTAVAELAKQLKQKHNVMYILDPVIGDEGRLYVDPDVVPVYRDILLPLATIITPNWFEVEMLTGTKIDTIEGLHQALRILHVNYKVPNVVISSLTLESSLLPATVRPKPHPEDSIYLPQDILCLCSSSDDIRGTDSSISTVHVIGVPRIKGYFSGVGDLFSAMVLAHYHPSTTLEGANGFAKSSPISRATTQAVNTTHAILLATEHYCLSLPEDDRPPTDDEMDTKDKDRRSRRMRSRELRIVQSADAIRQGGNSPLGDMVEWADFWKA